MGGLILGVNNALTVADEPLRDEAIRELDYLTVIDRRDLSVSRWRPPRENTYFAEHEFYIPAGDRQIHGMDLASIHASYIVGFGGTQTSIRDRRRYFSGFDAPVLQLVWDVLRRFDAANQSIDSMLQDGSQGVMMIRDLWKVVTQKGGLSKLETRLELSALYRAAHKWLILDAGGADGSPPEDFRWVQRSFAGLSDLTQDKQALVASVADMPITQLFGRSPAGENATGEHDMLNWQASVASWFRTSAQPQITRIVQIIARTLGASDPERFIATIPSLQQMSAQQQAELEERIAKTDDIRIQQGFPEAVILRHRYGQGEYKADPPMLTEDDLDMLERGVPPTGSDETE
jgi:phage-related protein (TIGR01555 family)